MPEPVKTEEPTQGEPPEVTQEPEKSGEPQRIDYEKSYKELQSKFNERDEEIKTARQTAKDKEELEKNIENWKKLGQVIESDPLLYKAVADKINPPTESNGEAPDELKETVSSNVVKEFEEKMGLTRLDPEKAQALRTKIGAEIKEYTGRDIKEIPLSKLAATLERGYTLATVGDKEEQARRQGYLEARENREAEFGNIPSSGVKGDIKTLTPEEQKVARRLNISDEDYAKYKDK